MNEYRSLHLREKLGEVLAAAEEKPTVLMNRGQPRFVIMSVSEFRRLKAEAGEPIPAAAMPRSPQVVRGRDEDPLGYNTFELRACALEMADGALSGWNATAVEAELGRVRVRLAPVLARPAEGTVSNRILRLLLPDNTPLSLLSISAARHSIVCSHPVPRFG